MIVTLYNEKGGVGKTATAVHLASVWAEQGDRVLLVDADSQGDASHWLGAGSTGAPGGTAGVMLRGKSIESQATKTVVDGVDVLTGTTELIQVSERHIPTLKSALMGADYDWVVIDTPASFAPLPIAGMVASDRMVIPITDSGESLRALKRVTKYVRIAAEKHAPGLKIDAVMMCQVDKRANLEKEISASLESAWGARFIRHQIRKNVQVRKSHIAGRPVTLFDSNSLGAKDYRRVAAELREVLGE